VIGDRKWCFYSAPVDDSQGSWGGDGNKKLDFPCTLQCIILDRPRREYKGAGKISLDGVCLLRRRKLPADPISVHVPVRHFGNVFAPGEEVKVRIQRTKAAGTGEVEVVWWLRDFWGAEHDQEGLEVGDAGHEFTIRPLMAQLEEWKKLQAKAAHWPFLPPALAHLTRTTLQGRLFPVRLNRPHPAALAAP